MIKTYINLMMISLLPKKCALAVRIRDKLWLCIAKKWCFYFYFYTKKERFQTSYMNKTASVTSKAESARHLLQME